MTDWKTISQFLTYMAHKFGLGLSTLTCENGFGLVGDKAFVERPELGRQFGKMTPKVIRRWLWDLRYDPVWREPGVMVYVERESPTSWKGKIGTVGDPANEHAIVFSEAS
jgi:hypothetical protein